jgi:hypothetical protein
VHVGARKRRTSRRGTAGNFVAGGVWIEASLMKMDENAVAQSRQHGRIEVRNAAAHLGHVRSAEMRTPLRPPQFSAGAMTQHRAGDDVSVGKQGLACRSSCAICSSVSERSLEPRACWTNSPVHHGLTRVESFTYASDAFGAEHSRWFTKTFRGRLYLEIAWIRNYMDNNVVSSCSGRGLDFTRQRASCGYGVRTSRRQRNRRFTW